MSSQFLYPFIFIFLLKENCCTDFVVFCQTSTWIRYTYRYTCRDIYNSAHFLIRLFGVLLLNCVSSYILVAHPFKSVCVYGMRQGSKFIHLPGYPVVSETSFFQLNSIDILVKNRLTLDVWICFWTPSSVFYMPVLMLVFHYFDYCHFVGSFEVVSLTSLSPFFFFFDPVLTLAIPCEFFKFIF